MGKEDFSFINFSNGPYIQELYASYLENPDSIDPSWRYFFDGVAFGGEVFSQSGKVVEDNIVTLFRKYGHLKAKNNPLSPPKKLPALEFSNDVLDKEYTFGSRKLKGRELVALMESIYCSSIGYECELAELPEVSDWIYQQIEAVQKQPLTKDQKSRLLEQLYQAEAFESFLHKRYPGQKRFSIEGNETTIPFFNFLFEEAAAHQVKTAIIGMAHRGRLNVLTHVMGKEYVKMFEEFEPTYKPPAVEKRGDVKYHKGYQSKWKKNNKEIDLYLAANPSHLESVMPVVQGIAKAKQNQTNDPLSIIPILAHGDASFAGQGVVYETMQMSKINGYETKGTIHLVINNQIGYTAAERESRSTRYCTDIAKTFSVPVLHVNAEDPESAIFAASLSIKIRQKFGIDVVIDLIGYRKYGHNETDEPSFTNPGVYNIIRSKKSIYTLYKEKNLAEKNFSEEEIKQIEDKIDQQLEQAFNRAKISKSDEATVSFSKDMRVVDTKVEKQILARIINDISVVPDEFNLHKKIRKMIEDRKKALEEDKKNIDWALAEHLAYGSLLIEGVPIRLSGEDSIRGTFSHRHAAFFHQETDDPYFPLSKIQEKKAHFEVFNSCLSEYGVMGFEYGYSIGYPEALVIWEGQFGDFANGAQIVIDQYIASGEAKWGQKSSLVLYLPHGYEGMGPEHSSARIERYLELCGDESMRVIYPSTPAQWFHAIRFAKKGKTSVPFIVFTPKEVLRFQPSFSSLDELANGSFQTVISDNISNETQTILFCSGKVYYDLKKKSSEINASNVAIVRIEQLYPYPREEIKKLLSRCSAKHFVWVQEEHKNMGAFNYIYPKLSEDIGKGFTLVYVGRDESASPATGAKYIYELELKTFIDAAFNQKG